MKTMFLANNVYGKHGGPYQPGTAIGLLFHLAERRRTRTAGILWTRDGRHGIDHTGAGRGGKKAGRGDSHFRICRAYRRPRMAARAAWFWKMAPNSAARIVLSNADPKRTFLGMVDAKDLPEDFLFAVRGIKMQGPCAKVNMVLAEEPRFTGTSPQATALERTFYTLVPSLEFAERCYDIAKFGEIPEELWVDCVVSSNADAFAGAAGQAHPHLLCAVCALPLARRQLGREA